MSVCGKRNSAHGAQTRHAPTKPASKFAGTPTDAFVIKPATIACSKNMAVAPRNR